MDSSTRRSLPRRFRSETTSTGNVRAAALAQAIRGRLRRPDGVFVDGLESDGTQSRHASQQANAWALEAGVVPSQQVQAVVDDVISHGNTMGVENFRVLLDALHAAGRDDAFVTALTDPNRPGYAQILHQGATFTWESWNARESGDSESHGWGATVLAVLQDDLLGVTAIAPGATGIEVRVPKTSVTRAAGTVMTQRGPIPITWTRDFGGHVTVDIVVPVNVNATVYLPARDVDGVSDGGRSVRADPGVHNAEVEGTDVVLRLGSGHYHLANTTATRTTTAARASRAPLFIAAGALVVLGIGALVWRTRRRVRVP